MKRTLFLFAALALLLCACSAEPSVIVTDKDNTFGISAENYSQSQSKALVAGESSEITVNAEATTKSGSVELLCVNSAGETVCQVSFTSGGVYSFKLTGPDTYTITITGSKFTGDCTLTWEILGAVATDEDVPEVVVINPNDIPLAPIESPAP